MTSADNIVASATAARHGLATHGQLRALGLSGEQIANRLQRKLLVPMHVQVYRHAAAPWTPAGRLLAAVLACGPGSVASHRSAARLHGLRDIPRWRPEVTVLGRRLPLVEGVTLHRTDLLDPLDVTSVNRIPVTTLSRTLLDLGAVVPFEMVERAAQDAIIRKAVSAVELVCVLERVGKRGRRGTAALRAAVAASLPREGIESRLELDLLALIRSCRVPEPVLQHEIVLPEGRRYRLDTAWPQLRVTIEADGRRWHSTRQEFERDIARSRAITGAGWHHYRFGWADIHQRAAAVRDELTAIILAAMAVAS